MFNNSEKIDNLNKRLKFLESLVGSKYGVFPGENYDRIRYEMAERVSIQCAICKIMTHLGVKFVHSPAKVELKPAPSK